MNNIIKPEPTESRVLSPPLLYDFYQSISIFSADSSISTGSGCERRAFEITVDPHLAALAKKAAAQSGDLAGRRARREYGCVKNLRSLLASNIKLYSLLPEGLKMFLFEIQMRCVGSPAPACSPPGGWPLL